jgi:hypothetical protein
MKAIPRRVGRPVAPQPTTDSNVKQRPELIDILRRQRERFVKKFGREPGPKDPVFFDPSANRPSPMNLEAAKQRILEAMQKAKIHPSLIHAFHKTGRLVSRENSRYLSKADLKAWQDAINEWYALHPGEGPPRIAKR